MKKTYVAPAIAIERYELTQTIAACMTIIGLNDSACVLAAPGVTDQMKDLASIGWFVEGACAESASGMDNFDGICVHTNANTAFTS